MPVLEWPDTSSSNWIPRAARRFLRRVAYRDPQPIGKGTNFADIYYRLGDEDQEEDGKTLRLFEMRNGKPHVRYGLYLSDIPAMLKAVDAEEDCWRRSACLSAHTCVGAPLRGRSETGGYPKGMKT